jgi:hypothetical protein
MKPSKIFLACLACLAIVVNVQAADKLWFGGAGDWSNGANWIPTGVPSGTDSVIISNGTVQVTAAVDIASLGLHGGTLQTSNTVVVTNGTWTGGTMAGSGVVMILGTLQITGSGTKYLTGGTLCNAGWVLWSGGVIDMPCGAHPVISNLVSGTFDVAFDGTLVKESDFCPTVYNAGLWRKSAGTGTAEIADVFNNSGTVEVQSGQMNLARGGGGAGHFVLASGTTLEFSGGTYTLDEGGGISSNALVRVTGATVNFNSSNLSVASLEVTNGSANFNTYSQVGQLQFTGGTLGGSNTVVVTNGTWSGGTMGGIGVTLIPAGGQWQISGSADKALANRTLVNMGTVVWSGSGGLYAPLGSANVISNALGGVFQIQTDAGLAIVCAEGCSSLVFYNAGALVKSAGTGTNLFSGVPLRNTGTVEVQQGTMSFGSGYQQTAGTLSLGIGSLSNFGRIAVSGTATLTRELHIGLRNGFVPAVSNRFLVATWGSRSGQFDAISGLNISSNLNFSAVYLTNGLELRTEGTNSPNAGTLQFSAASYTVSESNLTATITVVRSGGGSGAVGVSYAATGGTATPGTDYTLTPGTIQWADGEAVSKTFVVSIINDTVYEGNETVNLGLSSTTGGATLGTLSNAVLNILDDEAVGGRIVVASDDWPLGDVGFHNPCDPGTFARNVGVWFTGGRPGKFLVYSDHPGLTGASLANAMTGAGHTWIVNAGSPFDLATLQGYDGVFVGMTTPVDTSVLINYVSGGGHVYLAAACNANDPARLNPFLEPFGLHLDTVVTGSGDIPIASDHPLFAGVDYLYQDGGFSIVDLTPSDPRSQILVSSGSQGLYAVWDALAAPTNCSPAQSGLVGWWPGDGNANDLVGTNNGTLGGGVTFVQAKVGHGFNFTNTANSYIALPNSPAFQPTNNQLTIEAWIKPDFSVLNVEDTILKKRDGCADTFSYILAIAKGDPYGRELGTVILAMGGRIPWPGFASTNRVPDDGRFHHVAATFDGNAASNNCVIFLDGQIAGGGAAPGPIPVTSSAPVIGTDIGCGDHSQAVIDELSFYNRALTPSEIAAIYAAGSAGKCSAVSAPVITSQPQSRTNAAGTTATFSVTASGTEPLTCQWRFNGTNIINGTNFSGATAATLVLTNVEPGDAGRYDVVVSNPNGSVTSDSAFLTVLYLSDYALANTNLILIRDFTTAAPYPAIIDVEGVIGTVQKGTVTLSNLCHTWPADIDALLVGPHGQSTMLMSDAGGDSASGVTLTFDDDAAQALPEYDAIVSGTYKPTNIVGNDGTNEVMAAPAPAGPYGTNLAVFIGTSPNGSWNLFVRDDESQLSGRIAGGWSLSLRLLASTSGAEPEPLHILPESLSRSPDGRFQFVIAGEPGLAVEVLASADLQSWLSVSPLTLTNGVASFTDPTTNQWKRFYRVHPLP